MILRAANSPAHISLSRGTSQGRPRLRLRQRRARILLLSEENPVRLFLYTADCTLLYQIYFFYQLVLHEKGCPYKRLWTYLPYGLENSSWLFPTQPLIYLRQ